MRVLQGYRDGACLVILLSAGLGLPLAAQQTDGAADPVVEPATPPPASPNEGKLPNERVLGVLPNYRTADANLPFQPLTARRKLYIAFKDSTDWPLVPIGAIFAGIYHWENQNPSFGQGMAGYAKRFATAYADQVIGNFMTEGIAPAVFHQDPRYFRIGHGSIHSRLWYAATRIFVCKSDKGISQFNFAEVVGNSIGAGVGNAYYPDGRKLSDNLQHLLIPLSTDSAAQIGKEFWPDIKRKLFHKNKG